MMKHTPTVGKMETVKKYTPETISAGKSYACLYTTQIGLDRDNQIPDDRSEITHYQPLTGFAIINKRDPKQRLLTVVDVNLALEIVVSYDDVWDIDDVEVVAEELAKGPAVSPSTNNPNPTE